MTEIAVPSFRSAPAVFAAGGPAVTSQASGVVITGLRKGFGAQPVLRGVDLEVPKGSITAILGSSGSGKTTMLRLLAGFERPDGGTITIDGTLVDGPNCHLAPGVRRVGYVPQEGCLFPHLDVRANVGFGLAKAKRRHRVAELLEMTGLEKLGGRYPHQLSGGEQQRVALARALAPDPSLVLLDEPFSSLDASLRTSVRLDVARILGHAGTTTVIVTHDQDEALSMADQVAILRDGTVAQASAPQDLYIRPADARLAQFVGDANLLAGTVRAGCVDTAFGALHLVDGSLRLVDGSLRRIDALSGLSGLSGGVDGVSGLSGGIDGVSGLSGGVDGTSGLSGGVDGVSGGVDGTAVVVLVRPEQIELVAGDSRDPGASHSGDSYTPSSAIDTRGAAVCGVVLQCDYHGHDTIVAVDVAGAGMAEAINVRCMGPATVAPGAVVTLRARGPVTAWLPLGPTGEAQTV